MPRRPSLPLRLAHVASWPVGVTLTSWRYMWRTTPFHRRERLGSPAWDMPPELPPWASRDEVQTADDGVGPLFHRRYTARIRQARMPARELMEAIKQDPTRVAPRGFARFSKVRGERGVMRVGDEYVVRMPGPWDGPVRVVRVTPTSFRLATLEGHLEAGQIDFRAVDEEGGMLTMRIESWARSGDRLSQLLYERARMSKEVQLHMWTSFLEKSARLSGGRLTGGIDIDTRRVEEGAGAGRPLGDPEAMAALDRLHARALNYHLADGETASPDEGWLTDEYRQPLPGEPPGDPVPGGPWEVARDLIRDYEFADPGIITAVYRPDRPLAERDMLLRASWHGLKFDLGVRVGDVHDEVRRVDGRDVRVWGWDYSTLEGHLERGRMDFEVWKWLDTGEVEFVTRRFSKHASVRNPVVRLGLALFGRREQVRFAKRACERMALLTAARLDPRSDDERAGVPRARDEVEVRGG